MPLDGPAGRGDLQEFGEGSGARPGLQVPWFHLAVEGDAEALELAGRGLGGMRDVEEQLEHPLLLLVVDERVLLQRCVGP